MHVNSDPSLAQPLATVLNEAVPNFQLITVPWDPFHPNGARLDPTESAQLCFVDVTSSQDETLALLNRFANAPSAPPVVALLSREDPELALRCIRSGAWGCLVPPFSADQLRPILARIQKRTAAQPQEPSGKLVCLTSFKGACGSTVLAVTLADQLRRAGAGRILLADFDMVAGSVAFNLKLNSPHSSADALRHAAQLDSDLWRGLVVAKPEFDVLLAPDFPADTAASPGALTALLRYVRGSYDWVIADAGTLGASFSLELSRLADPLLLVLAPNPDALYAAKRWLPHLNATGVNPSRIRLLMNRCSRGRGIAVEQACSALGCEIMLALPEDPSAVQDALIEGKPVAPSTSYARQVRQLADFLLAASGSLKRSASSKGFLTLFSHAG